MKTHDALIVAAIEEMVRQNMTDIKVDHLDGYERPTQIGSYIPDITARYQGHSVICEAEFTDGLSLEHTSDQWTTFASNAARLGGYFIAIVNAADRSDAEILKRQIDSGSHCTVWSF